MVLHVQEIFYPLMYLGILIMIKALVKPATQPALSFPVQSLSSFPLNTNKSLYVVSNGLGITSLMTKITGNLNNMNYQVFPDENAALDAYTANKSLVAAGIIFGYGNASSMYQYAIRMPAESIADTKKYYTQGQNQGNVCVCVLQMFCESADLHCFVTCDALVIVCFISTFYAVLHLGVSCNQHS